MLAGLLFGLAAPAPAGAPSPLDGFVLDEDGNIGAMAVQPDGKVLIGGGFSNLNGLARAWMARLNADGSVDPTFNVAMDRPPCEMAVQADGKILLFTSGLACSTIARLTPDGSLDSTFATNIRVGGPINAAAVQADGQVLAGGDFMTVDGAVRNHIARLGVDGALDAGFNAMRGADGMVNASVVQPDGKLLLGGSTPAQPSSP